MKIRSVWLLAFGLLACSGGSRHPSSGGLLPKPDDGSIGEGGAGGSAGAQPEPDPSPEAGAGGDPQGAGGAPDGSSGEAGAAGASDQPGLKLPAECPGVLSDYTSVVVGDDDGQMFDEAALDGEVLVFGGSGDDLFFASPPGAPDCLLGGSGNDRFETAYLSAPSTFVGGDGDDVFVLRGSADSDTAHIADFEAAGKDSIHLDAMAYGLTFTSGSPLATEVALAPGFAGGNSNAGNTVRILYNSEDGGLWYDSDADGVVASAVRIAVIENFQSYSFDLNDFATE